jgi:L-asparaginase II
LPTFAVPLRSLALAYARFANAKDDATSTARALNTVRGAMTANPKLAGGRTSLDTALMSANPALLSKSGAEAVYGIALVDLGLGIAVKILDGNPRALPPVIDALLAWAGAMDSKTARALEPFLDPLRNAAGHPVGNVVADVPMLANGLHSSRVEPAFESPASNR